MMFYAADLRYFKEKHFQTKNLTPRRNLLLQIVNNTNLKTMRAYEKTKLQFSNGIHGIHTNDYFLERNYNSENILNQKCQNINTLVIISTIF